MGEIHIIEKGLWIMASCSLLGVALIASNYSIGKYILLFGLLILVYTIYSDIKTKSDEYSS